MPSHIKNQYMKAPDFQRILVAVDGSRHSEKASNMAIELAERLGSELFILHVIPKLLHAFVPVRSTLLLREYYLDAKKTAERWMDKNVALAKIRGVEVRGDFTVAAPSVVDAIMSYAVRKDVDLILVGTRGLGGFKKLLVGSVSSGVFRHAKCSVLVVR